MTLSQKRRLLNEAISSKRAITFVYRGEDFNRIGNPHAFGYGSDNTNNTYLRFYQTAGGSSRPLLEIDPKGANFRLMLVDEMEDIEILNEEFEPHETYRCCDSAIDWNRMPNSQVGDDCSC